MLDSVDRQLIHALHLDARVSFARLAAVLGVSDQTVARRYRRLQREHGLRVVGRVDPRELASAEWLIRLRCAPGGVSAVANRLARRGDTHWVRISSAGSQVVCTMSAPDDADRETLLLDELPATRSAVVVGAACLLHVFRGGPTTLREYTTALSAAQLAALAGGTLDGPAGPARGELAPDDERLIAALARDGRASHAAIALATGWHETTVRRRIAALRARRLLYFDLDLDVSSLGYRMSALLWIRATPARLDEVGAALAELAELPFVAATTGATNLVASIVSRSPAELYRRVADEIGRIDGVEHVEIDPILRTVKRAAPAA